MKTRFLFWGAGVSERERKCAHERERDSRALQHCLGSLQYNRQKDEGQVIHIHCEGEVEKKEFRM